MSVEDNVVPAETDVDRLERMLARHPCIGRLDEWERNYRFSRKSGMLYGHSLKPDMDVIEFHVRKAGTVTVKPGRNIMAPKPNEDWPDSAPMESRDGKFTLSSGSLSVSPCRRKT